MCWLLGLLGGVSSQAATPLKTVKPPSDSEQIWGEAPRWSFIHECLINRNQGDNDNVPLNADVAGVLCTFITVEPIYVRAPELTEVQAKEIAEDQQSWQKSEPARKPEQAFDRDIDEAILGDKLVGRLWVEMQLGLPLPWTVFYPIPALFFLTGRPYSLLASATRNPNQWLVRVVDTAEGDPEALAGQFWKQFTPPFTKLPLPADVDCIGLGDAAVRQRTNNAANSAIIFAGLKKAFGLTYESLGMIGVASSTESPVCLMETRAFTAISSDFLAVFEEMKQRKPRGVAGASKQVYPAGAARPQETGAQSPSEPASSLAAAAKSGAPGASKRGNTGLGNPSHDRWAICLLVGGVTVSGALLLLWAKLARRRHYVQQQRGKQHSPHGLYKRG